MLLPKVLFLVCMTSLVTSEQNRPPQRGPRANETERFRYWNERQGTYEYCYFCLKKALDDSTYNYMQQTQCLAYYPQTAAFDWSTELTPYEWNNKLFPFCNQGITPGYQDIHKRMDEFEVWSDPITQTTELAALEYLKTTLSPGCGPLPNITNIRWECEEDYSRQVHGVYFPCQGYCNITGEVQFHAYCNTGLLWEVTKVHSGTCKADDPSGPSTFSPTNNRALIIACACVGSLVFSLAVLVLIWWICKRYKPCKKRRKLKLNQNGWEEGQELQVIQNRPVADPRVQIRALDHAHNQDDNPPGGIHVNVHEGLYDELNGRNHKLPSSTAQRLRLRKDDISARGVKNVNQSNTDSVKHVGTKVDPLETFQKVLRTNSRDTSMSVGSQASSVDSSQTFDPSRTNQLNQSSNPPHSFPMTSSGTGSRLKTGSLDSSQVHSIFPKSVKKGTPIRSDDSKLSDLELKSSRSDNLASPVSRSDDLKSSVSSSVSGSSRRSQVSQNSKRSAKSYRSQHPNASFSEDEINDDIEGPGENMEFLVPNNSKHTSINAGIVSDEEDGVDETSKLLPVRGASMNNLDVRVGNLRDEMAQSHDPYSNECDRKLSSSNEEVPLVSVKEPVEHDDDADMRNPTEETGANIQVIVNGQTQKNTTRFHVVKGQPFLVIGKTTPGNPVELKVTRQGEGTDFIGKPLPELSQLPILQVNKAMKGDSGLFSWSMLNDSQQFDGTFEIIVQDQIVEENRRMEPAGGNEAQNNVEEVRGEPEILARSLPSQPFAGAPTLSQGSLDQTPKLSGSLLVHKEQPERQESNQVKGERLNSECEPVVFNDLDLGTYSDSLGTREGPSGLSSHDERLNHLIDVGNGLSQTLEDEQTVKKQPYKAIGPHHCCGNVKDCSPKLIQALSNMGVESYRGLAIQLGVDKSVFEALVSLEDPKMALILLMHLGHLGLCLGHLWNYFSQNGYIRDIIMNEHSGSNCPYCSQFFKS